MVENEILDGVEIILIHQSASINRFFVHFSKFFVIAELNTTALNSYNIKPDR